MAFLGFGLYPGFMDDLILVATTSEGGQYDTEAYQAGWEMGVLANSLARTPQAIAQMVRADNLRQADLLAMAYGYVLINHGFAGGLVSVEIVRAAQDF